MITDPTMASARPAGYLPLLDGLRAIAVALVVAYHLDAPWATGGFLGVDLFFVISGFLITTLLLRERENDGKIGIRAFWSRRFRRLVPALAVMTAATVALTRQYGIPEQWSSVRGDAFAALAYVANWHFVVTERSYFETLLGPSPLEHTWSLAVEEQWYLLWPVAVAAMIAAISRFVPRVRWGRWVPVVAIGAGALASAVLMAVLYDPRDPTRVYFGTDTRAQQLLVGAALAWLLRLRPQWAAVDARRGVPVAITALIALVAIAATTSDRAEWLYRGGFLAVSLIAAVVVWGVAGATRTSALGWLAWRPLAWAGTRSYGIYLWHWPIIVFVGPPMGIELARIPLAVVQVALTLVVAELSFRLVEQPVRRSSWRPTWVIGGWATACVAIVVAVAVILSPPADRTVEATVLTPSPRPATTATTVPEGPATAGSEPPAGAIEDSPSSTGPPTTRPSSAPRTSPPAASAGTQDGTVAAEPPSTTGTPNEVPLAAATDDTPPSMFVVGDSTAFKLLNGIAGNEPAGWHIDAYATIGCGLSAGLPIDAGAEYSVPYDERCTTWREDWSFWRHELRPDVTVVMIGAWEVLDHEIDGRVVEFPSDEWHDVVRTGISEAFDIAGGDGRPVAALSLPCMRQSEDSTIPATARNDPARVDAFNRLLAEEATSRRNVEIVDLAAVLCPGGEYLEEVDGSPTRYDGVHVTPEGAVFVMDWLVSELDELLAER